VTGLSNGEAAATDLKDALLDHLAQHRGYINAVLGSTLARGLGISERTLRGLVEELTLEASEDSELIGSACSGEAAGYFLITSERDLDVGTSHLRSRGKALFRRYAAVQRVARAKFGGDVAARLFSLEELDEANGKRVSA
jgi:hypothetical protein